MSDSNSTGGGISIAGLLGVAFVILKLTHVISWSWWWVTAPFWGGLAILLAVLAIIGGVIALAAAGAASVLGIGKFLDRKPKPTKLRILK